MHQNNANNCSKMTRYKYLVVIIDDQLSESQNTDMVYKKCQERLHFMRILKNLHIHNNIMNLFYKSMIESVLSFSIAIWYGKLRIRKNLIRYSGQHVN